MQTEVILAAVRDCVVDFEKEDAANDDVDDEGYNNLRSPLLNAAAAAVDNTGGGGKGSSMHSANADGVTCTSPTFEIIKTTIPLPPTVAATTRALNVGAGGCILRMGSASGFHQF